jgi:hypothetical protein
MEEFLAEFGMVRSERAGDRLYMRASTAILSCTSQKWARRDSSLPASKPHQSGISRLSLAR